MKLTKSSNLRLNFLLSLIFLFTADSLFAKHSIGNYKITVTSLDSTYEFYNIASITDSDITIFKKDSAFITLNVRQIIEISTIRNTGRALTYIVPIGLGVLSGNLLGKRRDANEESPKGSQHYSFGPVLSGAYQVLGTFTGFIAGTVLAIIIDQTAYHKYAVNTRNEKFLQFRKYFS